MDGKPNASGKTQEGTGAHERESTRVRKRGSSKVLRRLTKRVSTATPISTLLKSSGPPGYAKATSFTWSAGWSSKPPSWSLKGSSSSSARPAYFSASASASSSNFSTNFFFEFTCFITFAYVPAPWMKSSKWDIFAWRCSFDRRQVSWSSDRLLDHVVKLPLFCVTRLAAPEICKQSVPLKITSKGEWGWQCINKHTGTNIQNGAESIIHRYSGEPIANDDGWCLTTYKRRPKMLYRARLWLWHDDPRFAPLQAPAATTELLRSTSGW